MSGQRILRYALGLMAGSLLLATASQAATEVLIYRVPGVYDFSLFQRATAVHCTNYDSTAATVRVKFRNEAGMIVSNVTASALPNGTVTFTTNDTEAYTETVVAASSRIEQGTAIISATTRKIVCSANGMWTKGIYPAGLELHMVRFNQAAGQSD